PTSRCSWRACGRTSGTESRSSSGWSARASSALVQRRAERIAAVFELDRRDLMDELRELTFGKVSAGGAQARRNVGLEQFELAIFLVTHRTSLSLGDGSNGVSG